MLFVARQRLNMKQKLHRSKYVFFAASLQSLFACPHCQHLTPQDVQPVQTLPRLWRRLLWAVFVDFDISRDRRLVQRHQLGFLDEFEAEVEEEDDGDVDVRRDEGLRVPLLSISFGRRLFVELLDLHCC